MQIESDMPLWHNLDPSGNAPPRGRDAIQPVEAKGDMSNNGPAAWPMLIPEFKKNEVKGLV